MDPAGLVRDRRPSARREGDNDVPLARSSLRDANRRLRTAAPRYRQDQVNRQIRTTAVRRHRARRAGQEDFGTIGDYLNFMTGAGQ